MEVLYEEIKQAVLKIPLEETGEELEYRGRSYFVEPFSQQGPAGEYFQSSSFDGADIYLWEKVPEKFKRPVLLHEIIEADLNIHQNIPKENAHDEAIKHDMRFARETLDRKTFKGYEGFRANAAEFSGGK